MTSRKSCFKFVIGPIYCNWLSCFIISLNLSYGNALTEKPLCPVIFSAASIELMIAPCVAKAEATKTELI